jgi:hypothetical protein
MESVRREGPRPSLRTRAFFSAHDVREYMSEDDQRKWRYELDEVGQDSEPDVRAIEPGSPSAENVVFFLLGVSAMVGVLAVLLFA